jgi:hypothetical protein
MATLIGARKRGRKVEPFRLAAREAAAAVTAAKGSKSVTVDVDPEGNKGKGDPVTFSIPKGAALVPFHLTASKKDENVREQMRLAAKDVEKDLSVRSTAVLADNGEEVTIWHYEAR